MWKSWLKLWSFIFLNYFSLQHLGARIKMLLERLSEEIVIILSNEATWYIRLHIKLGQIRLDIDHIIKYICECF